MAQNEIDAGGTVLPLTEVLAGWRPGSALDSREPGWTWQDEYADLWFHEDMVEATDALATSIQESGIREPVLLGDDGRVWDGHHRIVIAMRLGIEHVPVVHAAAQTARLAKGDQ